MKKFISVILSAVLLTGLLAGCTPEQNAAVYPVYVQGAVFSGDSADKIPLNLSFDSAWLTKGDNTEYNGDLAAFSALLCADSYFREKDMDKGTPNRVLLKNADESEYDFTALLRGIGFTDTQHTESYKEKEYPTDTNDSVTMNMGHMSDGKNDIFVVVIRGCFSAQEWLSAFDPGSDSAAYTELTGEHSEWANKNHLKGFDTAAGRAASFIDGFIEGNDDPALPNSILITGHSRGGAIANILGAGYESNQNLKTFTYTFNTPEVTCSDDGINRETVFNIFDSSDFFTDNMPFADEHFYRYGRDLSLSIADSAEIREALAGIKGRDDYACASKELSDSYKKLFGSRFSDRASLYEFKKVTELFDSREEAQSRLDECLALIDSENGLGLESFFVPGEIKENSLGRYELSCEYCPAALLTSYSKILAYGEAAYTAVKTLFVNDPEGMEIAGLLFENLAGVNGGHLLINSYALTEYVK